MADQRAAWGIDIGQSSLKAIKLRQGDDGGPLIAEAFDYIQFPKILSQPDAVAEEIVPQAMQTFLSRNDLKGDSVSISVPGQSALTRFIQLPPVESKKLHEIVKYEARQQIPFALEDVIWDYQPLGAGSEQSGFLLDAEVGLFAMKKEQVHQQLRPYNNAKVEVDLIQIAPLALYSMLSLDELGIRRDEAGEPGDEYYIVLDMGCDNTTLMVSNGYKIWIRNVPIGGNHFTRALTKEMKLSFAKAEHLKCNATKSPDPRAVFQALRPVFNDYVAEIQRSIGFFSSVNRSAKVSKVIGLGNGFKLAGLQKFLQQNLQYPVDRPETFKAVSGDAVLNSPLFMENILTFAVPYGLALQGLGLSRMRTSLLPPEITTARIIRRKKPWGVAAAATLLLSLSAATAATAMNYGVVQAPEFKTAEEDAKKFGTEVSTLGTNYDAQKAGFAGNQARLDQYTTGLRGLPPHLEVFNSILAAAPRDDRQLSSDQIGEKDQVSILQFSTDRIADSAAWFNGLSDNEKNFMSAADKQAPPAGPAFLIKLQGETYKYKPGSEHVSESGHFFVWHKFVERLQEPTVTGPDGVKHDMRRLGISHATMKYSLPQSVPLDLDSNQLVRPTRLGARRGAVPAGRGPATGRGGQPANVKDVYRTDFTVEMILRYVPPEARPPETPPVAPGAAPVETPPATM